MNSSNAEQAEGAVPVMAAGPVSCLAWSFPNSQPQVTDQVVRSQSGNILQDTTSSGTTTNTSTYSDRDLTARRTCLAATCRTSR